MDYSIYIIKQNTPESKLLHHAGIDRLELEIVNWKGKKRRHGGYGRAPIEWRIKGIDNVEKLCDTLVRILGNRKDLDDLEKRAYDRANTTLKGINNFRIEEQRLRDIKVRKKVLIKDVMQIKYPSLSETQLEKMCEYLSNLNFESFSIFHQTAKTYSKEYIGPIEEARNMFYMEMKLDDL